MEIYGHVVECWLFKMTRFAKCTTKLSSVCHFGGEGGVQCHSFQIVLGDKTNLWHTFYKCL